MADTKIIDMEGGALGSSPAGTEKVWAQNTGGTTDYHWAASDIKTYVSASPTLVTPALGTPASGTLTNCTLEQSWATQVSDNAVDAVTNTTWTVSDWAGTDTSGGGRDFLTGASANHFIIPTGVTKVRFTGATAFASNTTGYRQMRFTDGTTIRIFRFAPINGAETTLGASIVIDVSATEEWSMDVWQDSGGNLDMHSTNANLPQYFTVEDLTNIRA